MYPKISFPSLHLVTLPRTHIERYVSYMATLNANYCIIQIYTSWLHRASNKVETFLLPTDTHNVKKHRVIKTF